MTDDLARLLRRFSRQMALLRVLYWATMTLVFVAVLGITSANRVTSGQLALLAIGLPLAVVAAAAVSIGLTRQVQTAAVLMNLGKLDDAEVWLKETLTRFSLSRRAKVMAAQLLASLMMCRGRYEDAVAVCRTLLRQPLSRLRHVWVEARLMLTDALLVLGRLGEAHEALTPVYGVPLSLETRMKLLPIQLRYELAAGHAASATAALREKVKIAQLMDSPNAALTHALLAEACSRENRTAERDYLAERARLYADLQPLAERHPLIAPIASGPANQ